MTLWSLGPLLGPTIGPIAGGFLSQAEGWRWIFWVLAIATGVLAVLVPILLSESYAPVLLERKAQKLRKETGNEMLRSKLDNGLGPNELFSRAIVRPSKLLAMSLVCQLMSLYIAVVYGILYVLFTTFTFVFEVSFSLETTTNETFTNSLQFLGHLWLLSIHSRSHLHRGWHGYAGGTRCLRTDWGSNLQKAGSSKQWRIQTGISATAIDGLCMDCPGRTFYIWLDCAVQGQHIQSEN